MIKGKSSTVTIDKEKNIVIKKFDKIQKKDYVRGTGHHCFLRELECLQRLQGHPNFPKLIDYNEKELTITMDYCGEKYVDAQLLTASIRSLPFSPSFCISSSKLGWLSNIKSIYLLTPSSYSSCV